ncbi:uncharacterized protein LOC120190150 [Hibiscus syriacus]|uniref:uncharacterized protein LOC120190150 n=1 Tax=Hibiscus syriacus TaxID=106335 RepID=UPI001923D44B|nr:uncharacterized protein LOC120190150 [Hibiscus syriacus]
MPSGSKKRKAAKKKKEQAASNIPRGNGDPRSQDERESDVGSPASQGDHNHHHPFNQKEKGKRGSSPIQSHVAEEKSAEGAITDAENTERSGSEDVVAVKIEKELGSQEDLESTLVTVQHIEHDKSSSSSRSNSDDESEKKSKEEAYNFGSEVAAYGNEDKLATVMSEEVLKVVENEAVGNVNGNSAVGTANVDNLVKTAFSVQEEADHATEVSANKSVPDVVEPGLKGSEEQLLPSSNGVSGLELRETEGKISSSSGNSAESCTVVDKTQHFESHDHSEKQPLVASTLPVVQRTSVLSCCGLFDVFTGSGR